MKRFSAKNIIIFIIIILVFSGCVNPIDTPVVNTQNPQVTDVPLLESSVASIGGDGLDHQNLADIKIESLENDVTKITLSFMTGSGISLVDQQVSGGVPNYSVSHVEGVDRMVIKLDGISNWTYRIYEEEISANDLIQGILMQDSVGSDTLYLYVSTKDDYTYRVDSNTNKIEIILNHINEPLSYSYYIKINAFVEYRNGYFNHAGFFPCLSSDGVNGVMLSMPFESLEEANEYLDSNLADFQSAVPAKEISVIYLDNNELPEYNYQNQLEQIINKPIGYKSDVPVVGEPLITEGRFLSWGASVDEFAYVKPYTLLGSQVGDTYSYEELWMRTKDGDVNILENRFTSIVSAAFSYDKKFLAFIDQNDENRMLQIVNVETGNIYIPADDGFGIDTSSFVWSNKDNRLYAITGEYDSKQLLCYDMNDVNDILVYALTEEEYMESSLFLHNDSIYFLKTDADNLTTDIFRADITTGRSSKLFSGNSFMLSNDGEYMVVNNMQSDEAEEYSFYLYDFATSTQHVIVSGRMIMDYTVAKNGTRVYYTVYKNAGWEEEYPLELYYYDVEAKESFYVMDMITGALYPAYYDGEVLIMSIFQLQDKQLTITYQVK